jgi:hypothetical protein
MLFMVVFSALLTLRVSKNIIDSYAILGENLMEINDYLGSQNKTESAKDLSFDAMQLANKLEQIKKEMACYAEHENESVTNAAEELDLWSIDGKDASLYGFFDNNKRYVEFINQYELYKKHVNEFKPGKIDFINNLFFEIDQNFAISEGEEEINLSHSILIAALYTLTDCQNKLLMISHELNLEKLAEI